MSLPLDWIRAQFPALDNDTIFLDNAAGSQVPHHVVDAVTHTLVHANANRGGAHKRSREITERRERIRVLTAAFLGAERSEQVAFGLNATNLITLVATHFARTLRPGDEIVVTGLDHYANVDPWTHTGAMVRHWPVRMPHATLDLEDLAALIGPRTRLLCMTAASNALGTLPDVRGAADLAHAAGASVMVDAVAAAPHVLPDVEAWGADMAVCSPYKIFGPHLGVLYLRDAAALPNPGLSFLPAGDPILWEPGTQNHEAIAGWGAVLEYFRELAIKTGNFGSGRDAWRQVYRAAADHEAELTQHLLEGLTQLGAELYGLPTSAGRTSTVGFNIPGFSAAQIAQRLADCGVAVAAGHCYAYGLVMHTLGLAARQGLVRASAAHYNTRADIDRLLDAVA